MYVSRACVGGKMNLPQDLITLRCKILLDICRNEDVMVPEAALGLVKGVYEKCFIFLLILNLVVCAKLKYSN